MIIALVQFRLQTPISAQEAWALFEQTASRYLEMPELVRKHYFRSDAGDRVGAVDVWRSRAAGEALYAGDWHRRVSAHYRAAPEITWLETPIEVDNLAREIFRI
jgi:hypothetical protein